MNDLTVRKEDFWKQMYEQAAENSRTAQRRMDAYRRRAEMAEATMAKWRKAVFLIGMVAATGLCAVFWVAQIGG